MPMAMPMGVTNANREARPSFFFIDKPYRGSGDIGDAARLLGGAVGRLVNVSGGISYEAVILDDFGIFTRADGGNSGAESDAFEDLVENDDDKEGEEEGVARHHQSQANHCNTQVSANNFCRMPGAKQ